MFIEVFLYSVKNVVQNLCSHSFDSYRNFAAEKNNLLEFIMMTLKYVCSWMALLFPRV